jgi:hypothetical protein
MKIIQQANRAARENAKKIASIIKRDGKRVSNIVRTLKRAGISIQSVYIDPTSYNISVTGTRAELDILFGVLRREGLTPDTRPKEKESSYSTYWRWEDSEVIWVWFSSTSCKRVQVGTEMKETPIYETVCEE